MASTAGYSGSALPAKLGLRAGARLFVVSPPPDLGDLLAGAPQTRPLARLAPFDVALAFVADARALEREFARLAPKLDDAGMIWIAWPKKSSGVATDLTEDRVRAIGLATDLVDVKVCAIDATWSGLTFVRRRADRRR